MFLLEEPERPIYSASEPMMRMIWSVKLRALHDESRFANCKNNFK
jgi:hypothetical protein